MAAGEGAAFGALLRRHRLAASLSQEALAERAGLSANAVAALERGRRSAPRPDTVALLAPTRSRCSPRRSRSTPTTAPPLSRRPWRGGCRGAWPHRR